MLSQALLWNVASVKFVPSYVCDSKAIDMSKKQLLLSMLALISSISGAQTNWDQIHQQNQEISNRIAEQQRQSVEMNEMGRRQQEQYDEQQRQQQDQQYQSNSPPQPQQYWVSSFGSVAFADDIKDGWIAMNFRSQQEADTAALNACQEFIKAPCKTGAGVQNGALGLARSTSGVLLSAWGADISDAGNKLRSSCKQEKWDCEVLRTIPGAAWLESGIALNKGIVVPPPETDVRNQFAVVAWTKEDEGRFSVWFASGHYSFAAAETVALDRCKQDSGKSCEIGTWVVNGAIVIANDDNNGFRYIPQINRKLADDELKKHCRDNGLKCTFLGAIDAAKSDAGQFAFAPMTRAWLGARYEELNEQQSKANKLAVGNGTVLTEIFPDSPAQAAGLKAGDIVTHIGAAEVNRAKSFSQLVKRAGSGANVTILFIRDGEERSTEATVGSKRG
jgi:hypothetical protein